MGDLLDHTPQFQVLEFKNTLRPPGILPISDPIYSHGHESGPLSAHEGEEYRLFATPPRC